MHKNLSQISKKKFSFFLFFIILSEFFFAILVSFHVILGPRNFSFVVALVLFVKKGIVIEIFLKTYSRNALIGKI